MYSQFLFPSPSGRCLVKLALLLVFCCFAECAAGSCISYGHSCWGGHGKRSHGQSQDSIKNNLLNGASNDPRWFLTRLLQTGLPDNRIMKGRDALQAIQALQAMKQMQDVEDNEEDSIPDDSLKDIDVPYEMVKRAAIPNDKLRLIKFLQKNVENSN